MQRLRDYILRFSTVLTHLVMVLSLWCMLEPRGLVVQVPLAPLVALLGLMLLADSLLVKKSAPMVLFVLLNAIVAIGCGLWLQSLLVLSKRALEARILFVALDLVLFADVALTAIRCPARAEMLVYFDLSLIFEALFIALAGSMTLANASQFELWGLLACILTLTSVASLRIQTSDARSTAGMALLLAVAGLLFYLANLALGELESMSASFVRVLAKALEAFKAFFLRIITAFFNWLSALFDRELVYEFDPNVLDQRVGSAVYRDYGSGLWVLAVLGIAVVAALVFLLVRLRGRHLKPKARVRSTDGGSRASIHSRRRPRIIGRLLFLFRYLRGRDTAAGLFIWLERRSRRSGFRRGASESPQAFVRRLSEGVGETPFRDSMVLFADTLERQFYSNREQSLPQGYARDFRSGFSRSVPQSRAR